MDEESVLQELLPACIMRKRKEGAVTYDNNAKRAKVAAIEQKGISRNHDIRSSIRVAPRQHPSPGVTRTKGVGIEDAPTTGPSRLFGVSHGVSGHVDEKQIATQGSSIGSSPTSHKGAPVNGVGKSISAPSVARKRTGRKRASSPPRRIQPLGIHPGLTRVLKRTREEKKRQSSDTDNSSDLFPPSLPPSPNNKQSMNHGKNVIKPKGVSGNNRIGKVLDKYSGALKSEKVLSSQRSHLARQNQTDVIDITISDGEVTPLQREKSKSKSRDVVEVSSDEDSRLKENRPWSTSNGFAPVSRATKPNPLAIIEILDSGDDELSSAPVVPDGMQDANSTSEILAQTAANEKGQLSLQPPRSSPDEPILWPPESASEDSEDVHPGGVVAESSPDLDATEQERTPHKSGTSMRRKPDVTNRAGNQMDVDEVRMDSTPSLRKTGSPPPNRGPVSVNDIRKPSSPQHEKSPEYPRAALPTHTPLTSPLRGGFPVSAENERSETQSHPATFNEGDSSSLSQPLPPTQRMVRQQARKHSSSEGKEGRAARHKGRALSGDVDLNFSNNVMSSSGLGSAPLKAPKNEAPGETSRTQLPRQWSLGMNLADAIMQASQDNDRRLYTPEMDDVSKRQQGLQEATEKSQLLLEMVQKPMSNRFHNTPVRHTSPCLTLHNSETGVQVSPGDTNKNIQRLDTISKYFGSGHALLEPPDVVVSDPGTAEEGGVGTAPAIFGNADQLPPRSLPHSHISATRSGATESPRTIKENVQAIESDDDELEYIDEPESRTVSHDVTDTGVTGQPVDKMTIMPDDTDRSNRTKSGGHDIITGMSSPHYADMDVSGKMNGIISTISSSSRSLTPNWTTFKGAKSFVEIDGFTVISWPEFRHDIKNFTTKCYLARDLPHTLQDYINHMSEWTRLLPDMRTVFTAAIQENTAMDEPEAPPITVENDVDNEPTPPWEFHYSNHMWHGKGVPPPDIENLTSCDCIGRCDPRSKSCACVRRQRQALEDENSDFSYDNRGRLKEPGYPIFECNDLCGCDDDCRNRVVQLGRTCAIVIKKTEHKGWGIFANQKKIYKGTFIGIYAGELLTDEEGEERGFYYDKLGRTYLFDIDFHHLKKDYGDWQSKYTVDAYHAGNFTRFLNHSCDPNCILNPCYINEGNIEKPLLAVFARRDIELGEELCFSYSGDIDGDGDDIGDALDSVVDEKNDAVYAKCYCGARNCKGRLFG
ncbi:hypothetical protein AX15_006196 [Amanita polypyramis BW_CC]|nr:hypothetical protein AX15_006196 [Amanita polypyramis BW_CC]